MSVIDVVAAVIKHDNKYLCAQRKESKFYYLSHKFEFPGGKIELNETPEEALHREISEELDTNIKIISILKKVDHKYPDFSVRITFYECNIFENQLLKKIDHNCLSWLSKDELHKLDWADADIPIVELLQQESETTA